MAKPADGQNAACDSVLGLYREIVRRMLADGDSDVMPNSSKAHASVILDEMLRFAKVAFLAYSGNMACDVWNDAVLDQIVTAANRGVDVRIVIAGPSKEHVREDVREYVTCLPQGIDAETRASIERLNHFSVADACAFRLETDRNERKAVFCANDPEIATTLRITHSIISKKANAA